MTLLEINRETKSKLLIASIAAILSIFLFLGNLILGISLLFSFLAIIAGALILAITEVYIRMQHNIDRIKLGIYKIPPILDKMKNGLDKTHQNTEAIQELKNSLTKELKSVKDNLNTYTKELDSLKNSTKKELTELKDSSKKELESLKDSSNNIVYFLEKYLSLLNDLGKKVDDSEVTRKIEDTNKRIEDIYSKIQIQHRTQDISIKKNSIAVEEILSNQSDILKKLKEYSKK